MITAASLRGAARRLGNARRGFAFVEIEHDRCAPAAVGRYQSRVAAHAASRKAVDAGYLGSFGVAVGRTSSVYHLSTVADYDARDAREALEALRPSPEGLASTETSVFAEATGTLEGVGIEGLLGGGGLLGATESTVFEMRTYELVLGYATVPKFLELYSGGLANKMRVDDTKESRLLSLLHSEAGTAPLNTVIELWRHESAQGSQRSRAKSREATEWRAAIGAIAEISTRFETQLLRPLRLP